MKYSGDFLAAVLVEQNAPLEIKRLTLPSELAFGQVLVKLHYSGICGSQLGEIDGVKGPDKFLPHLLGHEGSASVIDIGPGVTSVIEGDLVVLHWKKGEGLQAQPPQYFSSGQKINAGWVTTFNEYAIISENRMTSIPKHICPKVAALFGCAVTTGFGVIENNAKIKIGESIVVFGAGGIGLNIIQAAKMSSAYPIIAVDQYDNRLELAKKFGATHVINSKKQVSRLELEEILDSEKADIFIDNTGVPEIISMGYSLTKQQGKIVLVGVPRKGKDTCIHTLPLHFGKSLIGSHGGEAEPEKDIPRFLKLLEAGNLSFTGLISSSYKLSQINDAISDMRDGTLAGRAIIKL
jgi:S-(hydroxymethyl)glutathione dehydrogenase / alcohol dehydrogenase